MAELLIEAAAHGVMPDHKGRLLAVFEAEQRTGDDKSYQPLVLMTNDGLRLEQRV